MKRLMMGSIIFFGFFFCVDVMPAAGPESIKKVVAVGFDENPNVPIRSSMEDAHAILPIDAPVFFAGVFDGHGGIEVAKYVAEHLYENINTALEDSGKKPADFKDARYNLGVAEIFPARDAITQAILWGVFKTDQDVGTDQEIMKKMGYIGTTAIFALKHKDSNNLYVSVIADARAVLADNEGTVLWRSIDQTLKGDGGNLKDDETVQNGKKVKDLAISLAEKEFDRINKVAGHHAFRPDPRDIVRVDGVLAVPRGIGDYAYNPAVIPVPDITRLDLGSPEYRSAKFLIMACDGVWDVITSEQAAKTVRDALKRKPTDPTNAAKELVSQAYNARSRDNITAMVVGFEDAPRARRAPVPAPKPRPVAKPLAAPLAAAPATAPKPRPAAKPFTAPSAAAPAPAPKPVVKPLIAPSAAASAPSAAAPLLTLASSPKAQQALRKFIEVVKTDMDSISRASSIEDKLAIGGYGDAWEEFKKVSVSLSQDLKDRIEILRKRFLTAMAHFIKGKPVAELNEVLADFGKLA